MATPTLTDKPSHSFSELAAPSPANAALSLRERGRRVHIGLIVAGSIVAGLVLGLVLVLGVFGGSDEATITGSALISLGAGMLILFLLARRRTDQPQPWALAPAIALGVLGFALLIFKPGDQLLGWMGWIWPPLLALLVAWSVRGARRSLRNWSRRALLYPALAMLGLVALGGAFETVAEATSSNPAPSTGRTYTVAERQLYLECSGSGSPTVILFNGLYERTPHWAWVKQGVAGQTRVCTFDRAGQGWSRGGTVSQDARQLSEDARDLLAAAHIPGPYVLAGHSVGGTYALAYAMTFPADVAGVALIDSATPYQFDLPDYPGFYSMWRRVSATLPSLARAGLTRVLGGGGSLPPDARRAAHDFGASPRELRADRVELAQLPTVFRQTKELKSLDGKPLYVLTADRGNQAGWRDAQRKLATLSTNSLHRTATGATHMALLDNQDFAAVTARAIGDVVRAARSGTAIARGRLSEMS
ncbi:MAG: alpha/beta fold hydrolase [Gaiellaceae bacterium MAG52_C11]|nr:alpha/beta fold hydrolase [Candidatus Gaiellasilicea maunaloa]